jgi:hypothetical protein
MRIRRIVFLGLALLGAGLLAYLFAGTVRDALILPLAYYLWQALQLYRAVPQQLYWAALAVVGLLVALPALLDISLRSQEKEKQRDRRGQVELLAQALEHRHQGIYFRWQLANTLGELAQRILSYQERLLPGRKLRARDWTPPPEVEAYLDAGLNTTFADYPLPGRFGTLPDTPFDIDPETVVSYLESQWESNEHGA